MEPKIELKCPECGSVYANYHDYFACWTSHLPGGNEEAYIDLAPFDHDKAIRYYHNHPNAIEEGMRILGVDVSIFHGRIDLIGVDKNQNLCLIDVTMGKDWKRKVRQLRHYKRGIEWIGKRIFGISLPNKTRLILVKPNDYVKDVTGRVV